MTTKAAHVQLIIPPIEAENIAWSLTRRAQQCITEAAMPSETQNPHECLNEGAACLAHAAKLLEECAEAEPASGFPIERPTLKEVTGTTSMSEIAKEGAEPLRIPDSEFFGTGPDGAG